ncbi:cardiolipin synthase [Sphingobacterium sp. lm-10]|uniref:cardiolipin synthase n=1 Tax=Sphingobacterium sp. lm-10 TaxID=2944904 RepID=UPI002021CED1|nr:cardiolipin synthase [Sphingobacterium sp. lm-10]MCL7986327.1 cardiolipin synthase [Sphingobacterium sp. lm-10]
MKEIIDVLWPIIREWYWLPLSILYLGVIATILIENRNPTKTIAWVLVIVFLPILGIILYYLFGQKFKKERRFKRISEVQSARIMTELKQLEPRIKEYLKQIQEEIGDLSRVYSYLRNEQVCFPSLHNEVTLLHNGEEKFAHLLESLRQAKYFIHLEYYIFEHDEIGGKIMALLEEKANAGVTVRLLVDAFGSPSIIRYQKKHPSKIQFQAFLPVTFTSLANSNYRNHRKICIIDGESAYIGGINISDSYRNPNPYGIYWRDTSLHIKGESVGLLQLHFWTLWNQTDGDSFLLDEYYVKRTSNVLGKATVSFAASDPGSAAPYTMEALLIAIAAAQYKVQLCTPYYIPSPELETALMVAAASGVSVELMVPYKGDSWIVQHASFSFLKPLLLRGIKVYLYEKGFIHAKTVNIDDKLAFVGTVNLDTRSFYINYEIAAIVSDEKLGKEMAQQFSDDRANSKLLTSEIWAARPRWKRGLDSICRLLAPLL